MIHNGLTEYYINIRNMTDKQIYELLEKQRDEKGISNKIDYINKHMDKFDEFTDDLSISRHTLDNVIYMLERMETVSFFNTRRNWHNIDRVVCDLIKEVNGIV